MEFCEEGTLVDLISRNEMKLSEEQIIQAFKDICSGVRHMHEQDPPIAHRDLKIENVMCQNGIFKLGDFGSCSSDTLDYTKSSKSEISDKMEMFEKYTTLMYRPPEMIDQYLKYPVNTQSDIWMLGCILYTMCFAKHPFFEA